MTDQRTVMDRAFRAKSAMSEFLAPAFDTVADAYMQRMADIAVAEPWAADKITKLAMASRVVREVRTQIEALIIAGDLAKAEKAHADKIAAIPIERRKLMGIGLPLN